MDDLDCVPSIRLFPLHFSFKSLCNPFFPKTSTWSVDALHLCFFPQHTRWETVNMYCNITHIIKAGEVPSPKFNSKGNEADDSCDPHQTLQPSSQLPGKLYILRCSFRRLQFIWTVSLQDLLGECGGQTLWMKSRKTDLISEWVWFFFY